jgi:hypothetical protein
MNRRILKKLLPVFVVVAGGLGAVGTMARSDAAVNPPAFTQPVERDHGGAPAGPAAPGGEPAGQPGNAPAGDPQPGNPQPGQPGNPPKPMPTQTHKPDGQCGMCV